MGEFRSELGEAVFRNKYAQGKNDTWGELVHGMVEDVCSAAPSVFSGYDKAYLEEIIKAFKFMPAGRFLYYARRPVKAWNNCFLHIPMEDSREEWVKIVEWATSCLMQGGGVGINYDIFRPRDSYLKRTGGKASGPVALMQMVNELGRHICQGGSRRSAILASLNWQHADIQEFLHVKDWSDLIVKAKQENFSFPAPLDCSNITIGYDNNFLAYINRGELPQTFIDNCRQAMKTAEPGMMFNFGAQQNEKARNPCGEAVSDKEYDVCNLGSINIANINGKKDLADVVEVATKFLYCATVLSDVAHKPSKAIQLADRRTGLGLMGMHEWLIQRNEPYHVTEELHEWLSIYRDVSNAAGAEAADKLSLPRPVALRAIAPTGSISMLAGTTSGIEPLYAVAYKRRYLKGDGWHYQYSVDSVAKEMVDKYGVHPDSIETSINLAKDYERRIAFQADVQDYVDQAISSTINLPAWGSEYNNEEKVVPFAKTLAKYAHRLRGFTCYPDGSRGGQPLEAVSYHEAVGQEGVEYKEHDVCVISGKGGPCGE